MGEVWEPLVQRHRLGQASNHAEAAERAAESAEEHTETKQNKDKSGKV